MPCALVVDDNRVILKLFEIIFRRYGFDVILSEEGEEIVDKIGENPPDIAIVDLKMPGMDGDEIASLLRKNEKLKNIPIYLHTAISGFCLANIKNPHLFDGVLIKPISQKTFDDLIMLHFGSLKVG